MTRSAASALRRVPRRAWQTVAQRFYRDDDPSLERSCLIAGGARSATTWLAELVVAQTSGRLIFEPFQSEIVPGFEGFRYLQYMRPDDDDDALFEFSQRVFSGRLRDPWVDRYVEVLRPKARVIKEIRANLFLRWLNLRFPAVPLVFIIRHPCAVVASRLALGWPWQQDLDAMLEQPRLQDDFLSSRANAIEQAKSPAARHALIWCLSHLVPLQQFPPLELGVVFHEDLCSDPQPQLERVFARLGRSPVDSRDVRGRASMTARGAGGSAIDSWRRDLSGEQIADVLRVVEAFDLASLYGDGDRPTDATRRRFGIA